MDTQVADELLGSLVDGRYRIHGRVARGGMATVYTALDERLERTVALKIIHPSQTHDPRFLERFTDEAKTIARLTHPNVVAVYDQGVHQRLPYLVMEYVRGQTLREILAQRQRLEPAEALAILEQMLAAIAAAHRAGLVHRDVKPENVLVAEAPSGGLLDSVVKVADFGLARAVEASAEEESNGDHLLATVAYVAPELVTDGHADPRTDVYAAGIVLFEMLTGRVPYDGDQPVEVAWQHVDNDVPPPSKFVPGLSPVLDDLVIRATRRDPGARPTDAGALLAEVQLAREDLGAATGRDAATAVLPQVAERTMVVGRIGPDDQDMWPHQPPQPGPEVTQPHRRRAAPSIADRLQTLLVDPRARTAVISAAVTLGLLLIVGVWWLGFGRYTEAPALVSLTQTEAEARATQDGFKITYGDARFDEQAAKDVVLSQQPPTSSRIVKGSTITLVLSKGPERYAVPDVVGKDYDIAKAELELVKLQVEKGDDKFDDSLPAGKVISINPKVDTKVKPGDRITVVVSKGKAPITLPNVIGRNVNEARGILQQLGVEAVEQYKDSVKPKDEVIGQDPVDGSGVERGDEVKLEVSKGPEATVVPRVVDLPCQQAKATLEQQGLKVRIDLNPEGTVRFQNPGENSQVAPGTEIVLGCV